MNSDTRDTVLSTKEVNARTAKLKMYFACIPAIAGWLLLIPIYRLWFQHRENHFNQLYSDSPASSIMLLIYMAVMVLFSLVCYWIVTSLSPKHPLRYFFWPAAATILAELVLGGMQILQ